MAHENTTIQQRYISGDSDEMNPLWDSEHPAQEVAHYALYEDVVDIEFDLDTGHYRYVGFAGKKLVEPTQWFGG